MTRQHFIDTFGEDPIDIFGSDWLNEVEQLSTDAIMDRVIDFSGFKIEEPDVFNDDALFDKSICR